MQFADVTYRLSKTYCALDQVPHVAAALCDDFTLDPADYRGATGGVIVANPNAPTGFAVLPSAANFVFAAHPAHDAAFLAAHLRDKGDSGAPFPPKPNPQLVTDHSWDHPTMRCAVGGACRANLATACPALDFQNETGRRVAHSAPCSPKHCCAVTSGFAR